MKKTLSIITLALAAGTAAAHTLTPAEAYARMQSAAGGAAKMQAITPAEINSPAKTVKTSTGKPAAYLFVSENGSYVLAGADDLARPLLGYGTMATDAEMPPQMVAWLDGYAREIAFADSVSALPARQKVVEPGKAAAPHRAPTNVIAPMVSTRWNQDAPYNNLCPMDGSTRSYTGCVATALAQVMKYHNWPERGTGTGTATVRGRNATTMSLDKDIDWANMLDSYYGSATTVQKNAVANLMVMCGYAVSMDYSNAGSGAFNNGAYDAVVNHFNYDKATWLYDRSNYSLETWQQMLVDQLTNCGPLFYTGASNEGGHAFVFDGYDGNGNFHVNWGWGGAYDGYFAVDALNPEGQGIGGFEGGYNSQQSALLGMRKPVAGSVRPQIQLSYYNATSNAKFSIGSSRYVLLENFIVNFSPVTFAGDFGWQLTNTITGQVSYTTIEDFSGIEYGSGFQYLQDYLPNMTDGVYQLRLVTKETGYSEWVPLLMTYPYEDFCFVKYEDGATTMVNAPGNDDGEFTIESATGPEFLVKGESSSYSVTFSNTTFYNLSASLTPGIVTPREDGNVLTARAYTANTFNVSANSTLTDTVSFTLVYGTSFEPTDSNYLVLFDASSMDLVYNFGPIDVKDFTIESATGPEMLIMGDSATYSITFVNTDVKERSMTIAPGIIVARGPSNTIVASADPTTFAIEPDTIVTRSVDFNLTYTDKFSLTADNKFVLYDPATSKIIVNFGSITVKQHGEITIESVTAPQSITKDEAASYTITLKNTDFETLSISLAPALAVKTGSEYAIVASADSTLFTVEHDGSLTKTVDFDLTYTESFDPADQNHFVLISTETGEVAYDCGAINITDSLALTEADQNAAIYFTIDGIKVDNPAKAQLYIRIQGSTASKVRY